MNPEGKAYLWQQHYLRARAKGSITRDSLLRELGNKFDERCRNAPLIELLISNKLDL